MIASLHPRSVSEPFPGRPSLRRSHHVSIDQDLASNPPLTTVSPPTSLRLTDEDCCIIIVSMISNNKASIETEADLRVFELQADICQTLANPKRLQIVHLLKGARAFGNRDSERHGDTESQCVSAPLHNAAKRPHPFQTGGNFHLLPAFFTQDHGSVCTHAGSLADPACRSGDPIEKHTCHQRRTIAYSFPANFVIYRGPFPSIS